MSTERSEGADGGWCSASPHLQPANLTPASWGGVLSTSFNAHTSVLPTWSTNRKWERSNGGWGGSRGRVVQGPVGV